MKISVCSDRPILVPCGLQNFDQQVDRGFSASILTKSDLVSSGSTVSALAIHRNVAGAMCGTC
jgi:hypothetical protein